MPSLVNLPRRSNALTYDDAIVEQTADLLADVGVGQGVAIDDAQESAGSARSRARVMVKALAALSDPIQARTHILEDGNGGFIPVLSVKPAKPAAKADTAATTGEDAKPAPKK